MSVVAPFDPLLALRTLAKHDVRFIVIGGFACRIWGSPTITNDLDICYERAPANYRPLVTCLRELEVHLRGVDQAVPFILDEKTIAFGDSFTFVSRAGNLDLLGTPPGTTGYADLQTNAEQVDLGEGLVITFASLHDLIRMKRAAGRPKDRIELEILNALDEERRR